MKSIAERIEEKIFLINLARAERALVAGGIKFLQQEIDKMVPESNMIFYQDDNQPKIQRC